MLCFAPKELHCLDETYSKVNWSRNIPITGGKHFPLDQLVYNTQAISKKNNPFSGYILPKHDYSKCLSPWGKKIFRDSFFMLALLSIQGQAQKQANRENVVKSQERASFSVTHLFPELIIAHLNSEQIVGVSNNSACLTSYERGSSCEIKTTQTSNASPCNTKLKKIRT